MKIFDINNWNIEIDKNCPEGLSGNHYILTNPKTKKQYYFKPDDRLSGLNERLSQLIIKEIGLKHIRTFWCEHNDDFYIITKYLKTLKRLRFNDFNALATKNKKGFIKFVAINLIFDNNDMFGERFIDENGNIIGLDFSDTFLGSINLKMLIHAKEQYINELKKINETSIKSITDTGEIYRKIKRLKNAINENNFVLSFSVDQIIIDTLYKINNIPIEKFDVFLEEINKVYGPNVEWAYSSLIKRLLKSCEVIADFYYPAEE